MSNVKLSGQATLQLQGRLFKNKLDWPPPYTLCFTQVDSLLLTTLELDKLESVLRAHSEKVSEKGLFYAGYKGTNEQ